MKKKPEQIENNQSVEERKQSKDDCLAILEIIKHIMRAVGANIQRRDVDRPVLSSRYPKDYKTYFLVTDKGLPKRLETQLGYFSIGNTSGGNWKDFRKFLETCFDVEEQIGRISRSDHPGPTYVLTPKSNPQELLKEAKRMF